MKEVMKVNIAMMRLTSNEMLIISLKKLVKECKLQNIDSSEQEEFINSLLSENESLRREYGLA